MPASKLEQCKRASIHKIPRISGFAYDMMDEGKVEFVK